MPVLFTNNATTTLGSSILIGDLSLTVASGTGALFPATTSGFFYVALVNSSNQIEFVKVTARSSDTFTIVRAQGGSTARAYTAGAKVELRLISTALENFVQLDGTQTISGNKTFSGTVALSGGGSVSGTYTGSPTLSGNPTFSGAPTFSGTPVFNTGASLAGTFTGTPTISGNFDFSGTPVFSNVLSLTGSINTTNFKILQESGKLVIKYGTTTIMSISSAGVVSALDSFAGGGV
jgi:hypothetical protein